MQMILGSVGDGGANATSDVALVQAMLVKTLRPATPPVQASPYLASYDGACGKNTKAAIRAFQADHVFVAPNGRQSMNNPKATDGIVAMNDATWQKLLGQVPREFSDLRVLSSGKTVYVAARAADLQGRIDAVAALSFAPAFRAKVVACINKMFELYGIAVGVCPQGDRRTFQAQYNLLTGPGNVTNAGPGESNHNYGMAVDLGFAGLRWLKKDGKVVEREAAWLNLLEGDKAKGSAEALRFWNALRSVGTSGDVGLFRGPEADRPHLQNWSDAGVDMAARLAALLTRAGTMRWTGSRQRYQCDLGYGGAMFDVGSAAQIWSRAATVTVDMLTRARAASTPPPQPQRAGGAATRTAAPPRVTPADVTAKQAELRAEFEAAEANWTQWSPN